MRALWRSKRRDGVTHLGRSHGEGIGCARNACDLRHGACVRLEVRQVPQCSARLGFCGVGEADLGVCWACRARPLVRLGRHLVGNEDLREQRERARPA